MKRSRSSQPRSARRWLLGLSFMQSYAVDKKLRTEDLALERIDVITGAVLTGVIGFFVVVACAATLHRDGLHITDAADAAVALQPLAGEAGVAAVRRRPDRGRIPGCVDPAAVNGVFGVRVRRASRPQSMIRSRRPARSM